MPDENKILKIREIGMRFVETCATCMHAEAPGTMVEKSGLWLWGRCKYIQYQHGKHTGQLEVPANALTVCNDYIQNKARVNQLIGGLGESIPIESTPELHWVICDCGWEGWDTMLVHKTQLAGGDAEEPLLSHEDFCPECGILIESEI